MRSLFKCYKTVLFLSTLLLLVSSCSEDISPADLSVNQKIESSDLQTILETDDFSSEADELITTIFEQNKSGKTLREDCHVTEFTTTGFILTFDNCSVREGGRNLSGTITLTFVEGQEESAFTATYTDLEVDGIVINGTRSFSTNENISELSFTVVSDTNITLADGTMLEESGTRIIGFSFDEENLLSGAATIDGNWNVAVDDDLYMVNVTSSLKTSFTCAYIAEGIMELTKNGLEVSIDFGDGTCDDVASITYPDGTIEEIKLRD